MAKDIKKFVVTIKGTAPLIQHSVQLADPQNEFAKAIKQISSKRGRTEADNEEMSKLEFMGSLYTGEKGQPIIPSDSLEACLVAGAKKIKAGPIFKSGVFVESHADLEYTGPKKATDLYGNPSFTLRSAARVQNARVMRTRPIFKDWSAKFTVTIVPSLVNDSLLKEVIEIAGVQAGLGDWRPRHGRFELTSIKEVK